MDNQEVTNNSKSALRSSLKPTLIFIGALSILLTKEYVSAKLLMGLVLLDYFTTDFIKKLPLPVCLIAFIALIASAII